MVERIRELLDVRQLSPTQFADVIGIGRPVVSHILSGRNKASLEVVQKISTAFPDLALPWLLTGEGPMLAVAASPKEQEPLSDASNVTVTARPRRKEKLTSKKDPAAAQVAAAAEPSAAPAPLRPKSPESAPPAPPAPTVAPDPAVTALPLNELLSSEKAIRRIVIFYRDGTFTDYQPEP